MPKRGSGLYPRVGRSRNRSVGGPAGPVQYKHDAGGGNLDEIKGRRDPPPEEGPTRVLGWREWVELPDFGVRAIKAKIDTGARTSSIHAFRVHRFRRDGTDMVRFEIHPVQRSSASTVVIEAEVLGERLVRASTGQEESRLLIETTFGVDGSRWPIELTLTRRDTMGFRMLIGRQALAGRFLVDPSASFLGGSGAGVADTSLDGEEE